MIVYCTPSFIMWQEDNSKAMSDVTDQEVHQAALRRQFFGREKLLVGAFQMVEQVQNKGGMMVVEGGPGEGKTVFMVNFSRVFFLKPHTHSHVHTRGMTEWKNNK